MIGPDLRGAGEAAEVFEQVLGGVAVGFELLVECTPELVVVSEVELMVEAEAAFEVEAEAEAEAEVLYYAPEADSLLETHGCHCPTCPHTG